MGIDDNSFSQQLRYHASSLDLKHIGPVGDWDFGQSIRRATGDSFFYDLSLSHFWPLGLNHPLALKSDFRDSTPQIFKSDLVGQLPHLEKFKWVVLSDKAYLDFKNAHPLTEKINAAIDSLWGWKLLEAKQTQAFSVKLADNSFWVCSIDPLQSSDLVKHHAWLNLFLSTTIIGPQGRLAAVQDMLKKTFNQTELSGLNLNLTMDCERLSAKGIKAQAQSPQESTLHFPVSVLKSDLEQVEQLVHQARNSVC
jgi:hypothetical protein